MKEMIVALMRKMKIVTSVMTLTAFVIVLSCSSIHADETKPSPPSEAIEKVSLATKIKDKAILAAKIALRLHAELGELGIDSKEILKEAKGNLSQFRIAVPEHTRKRIIVFSREHEKIIAESFITDLKAKGGLYSNKKEELRVRRIAEKIIKQLPEPIPVKIYLVRDKTANAFCLLDGSVFIHSGLLEQLKDDNQLAAVIAHEYGHAAARHGAENLTKMLMHVAVGVYAEEAVEKAESAGKTVKGTMIKVGYRLGSELGVYLPYSRLMEYEADKLGVLYMARAGYNPQAMVSFFEHLDKINPDDNIYINFLSTHPMHKSRIARVKAVIAQEKL